MKTLLLILLLVCSPFRGLGGYLGWNCRCTVVQVRKDKYKQSDSTQACQNGAHATTKQPSFRFNSGKTKTCFPDTVSYYKHAGKNREERRNTEIVCETLNKQQTIQCAKEALIGKTAECTINGQKYELEFIGRGIHHYARDIFGEKNIFWIKNEILPKIQEYIKTSECVGKRVSDLGHNTNKETIKLKEQTDYFFYSKITLPNGETAYLHLGRYNAKKIGKEGKLYLYTITKNPPKDMEEL